MNKLSYTETGISQNQQSQYWRGFQLEKYRVNPWLNVCSEALGFVVANIFTSTA